MTDQTAGQSHRSETKICLNLIPERSVFANKIFCDSSGKEPFSEWIDTLPIKERARILTRLDRVETGNMGDCRSVGDGVSELRFHF